MHARRPKKQASRGGVVRKRWHHKCAIGRQSRTRRCTTMNELLRGQECLRRRRAASVPRRMRPDAVCASYRAKGDSITHERCSNPHGRTPLHPIALTRTPQPLPGGEHSYRIFALAPHHANEGSKRSEKQKSLLLRTGFRFWMAGCTRLELATSDVTGRRSNQLS